MGYGKYWNFERVIAKAQAWASQKGYHLGEHFVEFGQMVWRCADVQPGRGHCRRLPCEQL